MQNKDLLIPFVIIIILFIGTILFVWFSNLGFPEIKSWFSNLEFPGIKPKDKSEQTYQKESELAILQKVAETKDITFCKKAANYKDCIVFGAQLKGDPKVCDNLTDKTLYEQCLAKVAEQVLSPEICERLPSENIPYTQGECFLDAAVATKKVKLCEKAGEFSDQCKFSLAIETRNVEQCNEVQDNEMRDFCFYYISIKSSKVRPCHLIKTDPLNTLCIAQASLNPAFCGLLQDSTISNLCYRELAFQLSDAELCNFYDFKCIIDVALKKNDPTVCELIIAPEEKNKCKLYLAARNGTESICTEINDPELKAKCFTVLALVSGNPQYCENIKGGEFEFFLKIKHDMCIHWVAENTADLSVCDRFDENDDFNREVCVQGVFHNDKLSNPNPQLCQKIKDNFWRADCYYHLGLTTGDYEFCKKVLEIFPTDEDWGERYHRCLDYSLAVFKKTELRKSLEYSFKKGGDKNSIIVNVKKGESITHVANRAFNEFLRQMSPEEKSQVDFELTLGHRVYIEDYLANSIISQTGNQVVFPGQKITFPRKLILEAILTSKNLTKKRLQTLSQYAFGQGSINLPVLKNEALSYCFFQDRLLNYSEKSSSTSVSRILCEIKLTGDYGLCEELESQDKRELCYERISEQTPNYLVCERSEDPENKDLCYEKFALTYISPKICEKIKGYYSSRDSCIRWIAKIVPSPEMCEMINDKYYQADCYEDLAVFQNNPSFCEKIVNAYGFEKWTCYKDIAISRNDPSLCEKILPYHNEKTWCYIELAKKRNDPGLCEKIEEDTPQDTEYFKNTCYTEIGEEHPVNCASISDYEYRALCYSRYYDHNKYQLNTENCQNISGLDKDFCYLRQGDLNEDPEICKKIQTKEIADYCLYLAFLETEESKCEKITCQIYRDHCFLDYAQKKRDYMLCKNIEEKFERDTCFNNVAHLLHDKTPCKFLSEGSIFEKTCGGTFEGPKEKYIKE